MPDWKTEGAQIFGPLSLLAVGVFAVFFHYVYYNRKRADVRAKIDEIRPYMNVKSDWIFLFTAIVCDLLFLTFMWTAYNEWVQR